MPASAISRDSLLELARALPAAPKVMGTLCDLLQDINTDLEQIAAEIRLDPALAARVIRLSNSIVYGGGGKVGSVDEAVHRVGFSEVMRLVGAASVAGFVDRSLPAYRIAAEQLRESLLLHALASEALADLCGLDSRMAYAGGLLRALGTMVLDRSSRRSPAKIEPFDPERFESYWHWENSHFGITGSEVTTMILDEWRFPAELVSGLEDHLLVGNTVARAGGFACLLNVAGAIVGEAQLALPGEVTWWERTPEKLKAAGLSEDDFEVARTRALEIFVRQRSALN